MTIDHILNNDSSNNNNELVIEYKNEERIIPLNNSNKYTNEKLDFTIIEILSSNSIFSEIKYIFYH